MDLNTTRHRVSTDAGEFEDAVIRVAASGFKRTNFTAFAVSCGLAYEWYSDSNDCYEFTIIDMKKFQHAVLRHGINFTTSDQHSQK